MEPTLIAQFWLIGMLLTLTPGADWAFLIASGTRSHSVVPSVLGLASGYALVIGAVALGVGALISSVPAASAALTLAGAGYLLFLGFSALLGPSPRARSEEKTASGGWAQFARGVGLSSINPKGVLLLVALLPQFTSPGTELSPALQMLVLGAIQLAGLLVVYFTVGLLARRLLGARPRASAVVAKTSGALMVMIGLALLIERGIALL